MVMRFCHRLSWAGRVVGWRSCVVVVVVVLVLVLVMVIVIVIVLVLVVVVVVSDSHKKWIMTIPYINI